MYSGSFTIPLSGLAAQQQTLGAIANNIANALTIGYRSVDIQFSAMLGEASSSYFSGGGVATRPVYNNSLNGGISASYSNSNVAINGQGFFVVTEANGSQQSVSYYTRAGDFALDKNNNLVNGGGYYANGYAITDGVVGQQLEEIQINNKMPPAATANINYSANLPADALVDDSFNSSVVVFDGQGQTQEAVFTWTKTDVNKWTISTPSGLVNSAATTTIDESVSQAAVVFDANGNMTSPASISLVTNSGTININFGNNLTQFSGTSFEPDDIVADGYAKGNLYGISVQSDGTIIANYDNDQSLAAYKIALAQFSCPNALQPADGCTFAQTAASGDPIFNQATGASAFGSIIGGAVESSNVDLADQFTKMIIAERVYTANAKVLDAADQMLQEILNLQ